MKMFDRNSSAKYAHAKRLKDEAAKERMILSVPESARNSFKRKPYQYKQVEK